MKALLQEWERDACHQVIKKFYKWLYKGISRKCWCKSEVEWSENVCLQVTLYYLEKVKGTSEGSG